MHVVTVAADKVTRHVGWLQQVLCSVADVQAAVREMHRVLKPGGKLLFLEHVAAGQEHPFLRLTQAVLNPLQQALADGCNLTR